MNQNDLGESNYQKTDRDQTDIHESGLNKFTRIKLTNEVDLE